MSPLVRLGSQPVTNSIRLFLLVRVIREFEEEQKRKFGFIERERARQEPRDSETS